MGHQILECSVREEGDGGRSSQLLGDAPQHHADVTVQSGVLPALPRTLLTQLKELAQVNDCFLGGEEGGSLVGRYSV